MAHELKRTAVLLLLSMLLCLSGCGGTPFSSEDWIAADQAGRQEMARSLMKEYDLVGWTEADVLRLLGPETSADPNFTYSLFGYDTEDTLVYALGAVNYARVRMLVITLDADRIVTKAELIDHDM
ncbi:MAG: hypothetical protein E7576_16195 [Ruminococcaceae bacterium]|jgi:hypothetical protein|nr:hypothetical protein [Oscillospiraceae bacterium]